METNTQIDLKILDAVSNLIFYESSLKSDNHPIDIKYVKENEELLKKVDLKALIVIFFNNFPELFVHRFLLCILDRLVVLDENEWGKVIKTVNGSLPLKSLKSFFITFLGLNTISIPNDRLYEVPDTMVPDEDDKEFISENNLQIKIEELRLKMVAMTIFSEVYFKGNPSQ